MRYKGCHQAHNAKVVICAFFTTPNSLKLQERRKAFLPIRKVRAIIAKVVLALTAAKSPQRLTRHLATRPPVSFIVGFRTPDPVQAASSRSAVIRNPSQEQTHAPQQMTSQFRSTARCGRGAPSNRMGY